MSFQAPLALFWFLPVGGFILALYLLRLRRRDFRVPASFLWPERQDEVRANSLFQRLKFNWLWVLQLSALALLVLGLARWQVRQENVSGLTTVLIVDASASMGAKDVAPDRFGAAVKRAEALVAAMKPGDRIAVIESGASPRVATGLSQDQAKLRQGLGSLRRSDAPSDVGEALRLAMALVGRDGESRIILLSDGCFDPVGSVSRGKSQIIFEPVGTSSDNLGIQALGTAETTQGLQAYVGVKNYGRAQASTSITVYADGKAVSSHMADIAPGQTAGKTVSLPPGTERVSAKLGQGGALACDDQRTVPGNPTGSVKVLLVSKGNLFLETGLNLDARVVLDKAAQVPASELASSPGKGAYDLVVFDSEPEVAVKAPMTVSFGKGGGASPAEVGGKLKTPQVLSVRDDGLMDGVSFDGVYLASVYAAKPRAGAQTLAEASSGPIAVFRATPKFQAYFAFDLLDGDFPLSVSFPILLGNILDKAAGSERQGLTAIATGQVVGLPGKDGETVDLKDPAGEVSQTTALNGRFTFRNLDRVGEYAVGSGTAAKRYLANMVAERESDIAPVKEFAVAGGEPVKSKPAEQFADLWKPLVALMMGVLALEWFVFMRRS